MKKIALAVVLSVALVGCGVATVISIIDSALPIAIQLAAGVGVLPPAAVGPINAALDCISNASTELASMDSEAQKSIVISESCLTSAGLVLPAGSPQNYVNLAEQLVADIQKLLAGLPPAPAASANIKAAKPSKNTFPTLTQKQKDHLLTIAFKVKAAKIKAR